MTFPSLPTDSLYKFLFVGGLILLITSLYYDREKDLYTTKLIMTKDSVENNLIIVEAKILKSIEEKDTMRTKVTPEKYKELETRVKKRLDGDTSGLYKAGLVIDLSKSDSILVADHNKFLHLIGKFNVEYSKTKEDRCWIRICIFFASLFIIVGIFSWYPQQKIQDDILKLQKDLLQIELEEKTK
jgi:hypothetical protein